MAEGGKITGSREGDELLCCTVCMEEYQDPRALPCLHTFCYSCLLQLSLKEDTILALQGELSSNVSQQKEVLKCPLCSEEHPVPKDKGVAGFRKDFRINKLRERQREVQTKEISSIVPGNDVEKCSFHPEEKLLYHCENPSCNRDICEVCWTNSHDKHIVTLLSKKLKDARDALRKVVGKNMEIIVSQLELLSDAKKEINDRYGKVKNDLRITQKKLQAHLNSVFDQRLAELDRQTKMQVDNISDKIRNVSTLKDSFQDIENEMDKTNVPVTSKTLDQYSQWQNQMLQASSNLDKWRYSFNCVELPDGKVQTDNFNTVKDAIISSMAFSYYEILLDNSTEKKREKEHEVSNPSEVHDKFSRSHLKYVHSFEIMPAIRGIAVSRNNLLYAVNRNCLACSEVLSYTKKCNKIFFDQEAKAVALVYSKSGTEFVVVLNELQRMLMFFSPQQQRQISSYMLPRQPAGGILTSSENLLAYTFINRGKGYVSLLSVNSDFPAISTYGNPFEIPLESGRVRAMHLSISNTGNPVLACSSMFVPDSTKTCDTAVVLLIISNEVLQVYWKMSFDELDSNISMFNLKNIACDSDHIFVLNKDIGILYRITKLSSTVRKMKVKGQDFSFSSVNRFCLGSELKNLYTSNKNNKISIFNYC